MKYKHLTLEKRYQIQAYKEAGFKKNEIAKKLNVHPSTIGRELKRNIQKEKENIKYQDFLTSLPERLKLELQKYNSKNQNG